MKQIERKTVSVVSIAWDEAYDLTRTGELPRCGADNVTQLIQVMQVKESSRYFERVELLSVIVRIFNRFGVASLRTDR